jgi:tellurite resistance protein
MGFETRVIEIHFKINFEKMAMIFQEILDQFRKGKANAKSHIKSLIEMACADGRYSEEENELLLSIASRNGISVNRINEIRASQTKTPFGVN